MEQVVQLLGRRPRLGPASGLPAEKCLAAVCLGSQVTPPNSFSGAVHRAYLLVCCHLGL
jgi:hypothetical protein